MQQDDLRFRAELRRIVRDAPWLMHALHLVREASAGRALIGAGAIRNLVWDALHDRKPAMATAEGDVDVVLFDSSSGEHEDGEVLRVLRLAAPACRWEVTNQAHVHRWYRDRLGNDVAPFESLESAIAAWPETATCVAVRLAHDDTLDVVAPHGLEDLFGLVLRPTRECRDPTAFQTRLDTKNFPARWPRLRVI